MWWEELSHWKRPWCWVRLKAGEGDDRGQDGWMASLTQWTWVWASSWRWWRTGKTNVLQCKGLQRVIHDGATEQQCGTMGVHMHAQLFLTLWDPMDSIRSGSSVHGIFQPRILEWVAISNSKGSSQPRKQTILLHLLHWQADSLPLHHLRSPLCGSKIPYQLWCWHPVGKI